MQRDASRNRLARGGTGRRRATWSILDQGLSSFTNFGLSIIVAKESNTRELGAFEILFSIYLFAVGCSRALSSEPLLVRHSDDSQSEVEGPAARAMGAAFVVSIVSGLLCLAISPFFEDAVRGPLLAFGVMMPGLLVQDAWRYVFFAAGRPAKAFVNDAVWTVVQFALLGWLLMGDKPGLTTLVLAWGISALVGAVIGIVQAGIWPRPLHTSIWLRDQRELALRFLGEFTVGTGAAQLCIWLIGLVGGLKVLGALRGALVLIGPMRIFLAAAPAAAIPELVRLGRRSKAQLNRAVAAMSWGLTALVGFWGAGILLLPNHVGIRLLGENWKPGRHLLPLVALSWALLGLGTGAMIGLRVLADARRSFRARLIVAPFLLIVPPAAVFIGGATGAAVGLAVVSGLTAAVWWAYYRSSVQAWHTEPRRHLTSPSQIPGEEPEATLPLN